jgi:hypothetical protein
MRAENYYITSSWMDATVGGLIMARFAEIYVWEN